MTNSTKFRMRGGSQVKLLGTRGLLQQIQMTVLFAVSSSHELTVDTPHGTVMKFFTSKKGQQWEHVAYPEWYVNVNELTLNLSGEPNEELEIVLKGTGVYLVADQKDSTTPTPRILKSRMELLMQSFEHPP